MDFVFRCYRMYASLQKYNGKEPQVLIPESHKGLPVTQIEANAFRGNEVLTAVFIPRGMELVGAGAFRDCKNLVYVGSPVQEDALPEESIFPSALDTVEEEAFSGTGLKDLSFLSPDLQLGDSAFARCHRLGRVSARNCIELTLGPSAFEESVLTEFSAPLATVLTIPERCFCRATRLKTVTLQAIRAVEARAFYECAQLQSLSMNKSTLITASDCFQGCIQLKGLNKSPRKKSKKSSSPVHEEPSDVNTPPVPGKTLSPDVEIVLPRDFDPAEDRALFRMELLTGPRLLPKTAVGIFREVDACIYAFQEEKAPAAGQPELLSIADPDLRKYLPLLNYAADNKLPIRLTGKQTELRFYVQDLTLAKSSAGGMNSRIFNEIKQRLGSCRELGPVEAPSYQMTQSSEIETFMSVCRPRLPAWVVKAYDRNTLILKNASISDTEERRHAALARQLLVNIDWNPAVMNIPPAAQVRELLDRRFYGLQPVKTRLCEIVAQIRRTGYFTKYGILLNGPAGVGKTAIALAVGKILGLPIIKIDIPSLGRDVDALLGSSRIYKNARHGRLLQAMEANRSSSAVLIANEIDKPGSQSFIDALLTVLDHTPLFEQFLEENLPTDNLFCIATCNNIENISAPLRSRFFVIDVPAYTIAEKKKIWTDYVLPAALNRSGISPDQLRFTDEAVDLFIEGYTRQAGARDLEQFAERFIGDFCLHAESDPSMTELVYSDREFRTLLGPQSQTIRTFAVHPGVVQAVCCLNGEAVFYTVEAAAVPGTGKLEILGAPGQQDNCRMALHAVRNTTGLDLSKLDITLFLSVPLPGGTENLCGFACFAAICSLLAGRILAPGRLCFTGGCDLYGSLYYDEQASPILLSTARRLGISTLYAPLGLSPQLSPQTDPCAALVESPDARILLSLAASQCRG